MRSGNVPLLEMGSGSELESEVSGDDSEDDVVEDLEVEKGKKRNHSVIKDSENEGEDGNFEGGRNKKVKFISERETKKLSKPATAEELNRLRETENLFHSNLFRLQIEEMLKEVQLKQKYKREIGNWFEKFQASVIKMADGRRKYDVADTRWLKQLKMKLPIPQFRQVPKGVYVFRKPINVYLTGSFHLETVIGPKITIDIVIEIPHKFYKKEDYSNGVYHLKRAIYMCDLISRLKIHSELLEDVNFISDGNDVLKPKIEIKPHGKLGKNITVLLDIIPEVKGMNLSKFNVSNNNVCMKWFFNEDEKFYGDLDVNFATPFYNSTILSDLTLMENYKFLNNLLQPHKNLKDGIILLKVWLRQRELTSGLGDLSGYLVTMLVAYLLQMRKINAYMSSYQVFRTVLIYLVSSDWINNGITLCKNADNRAPTMSEFHKYHKVVFVDTSGYYNLCYAMHPSTFQQVQNEARIALAALDDPNVNSFQILFMTSVPFYRHYDHLFIFHNNEALLNIVEIHGSAEDKLNHCGTLYPQLLSMVYDLLKHGFNKRISHLHVKQPGKNRWKPNKKFRHCINLSFGINLDLENYFLTMDKAAEGETSEFREFWGSISELRRFQDGTITEAVNWDAELFSEKRLICKKIVTYLMKYKFGMDSTDFQYIADQFDHFINKKSEESARKVTEVFGGLSKQLRGLKNLPLEVVSVQGASPVFRYTEVSPVSCNRFSSKKNSSLKNGESHDKKNSRFEMMDLKMSSSPPFVYPVQVVIQMGATNKWPQDLGAVRRLRTAFYVKIAQALNNQGQMKAVSFIDKMEVKKEGYVFHIKIFCPNEIGLVKQTVEDGIIKYRDNEISLDLEKQMVLLPKLSSALHGLYEQYSSFGPACCMVKRWISSQMIDSSHISEEVLEMLVASLYLKPIPHEIPKQPQVAFFRFLYMMSSTNWNTEYIVLNINNELNREDMLQIETNFTENRETLPALFLVTPFDRTKSLWTKDCPTPLILLRLVQLCQNALDFIEKRVYKNLLLTDEFKVLFEPSLEPYNVVIHLNKNHIPRMCDYDEVVNVENDKETEEIGPIPVNGFDPVSIYVNELRESYNDVALFFFDRYGGSTIGVLWKPDALEAKDFKVSNMAMRSYDSNTKELQLSKELVIEDFLIIGKGIVKCIDLIENGFVKSFIFL